MAANANLTKELVADALEKGGGIHEAAGRLLGVTRQTVRWWVEQNPELKAIVVQTKDRLNDMAEINLVKAINSGDVKWSAWWLERMAKDRGFSPRVETTGPNGGPVDQRVRLVIEYVDPPPYTGDPAVPG